MTMSCGGSMMRISHQPLAHLVDGAAEKWLAVENASLAEQQRVREEISGSFSIGARSELTFHGLRFLLSIFRSEDSDGLLHIKVHEIVTNN
jgi:hypothetical protein